MNRVFKYIAIAFLGIFTIACQKELSIDSLTGSGGGSANSVIGKWKFINIDAKTESIVEATDGIDIEKSISFSNYVSTNNKGTITIDATTMNTLGLGYDVNTTVKVYLYLNGTLDDSLDAPFSFTVPLSNGTSTYKQISSDSLYFENGGFVFQGGATQASQPGGARIKFEGNRLLMTSSSIQTTSETNAGITQKLTNKITAVFTLEKQ
ncbi:MAG: hypothetical protein ACKVOW_04760 [Chitinophagaceae bacterium]